MQYFVGLKEFTTQPVFDPSLFVDIRKRVGHKVFDSLNVELIKSVNQKEYKKDKGKRKIPATHQQRTREKCRQTLRLLISILPTPTDNGILNQSRKQCEKIIDKLYNKSGKTGVKPRTYRREIDKAYLEYSKKKRRERPRTGR